MISITALLRNVGYKNDNQVFLSGCCYRSIDLTAIDSANVELGAQHIGLWAGKYTYNNISPFKAYRKKRGWLAGCIYL
jgi:hypothetical protein